MAAAWAKEASSSSITRQPKHEVFLSFSGIDTRKNFTGHLLAALKRHGFHTFRDDEKLERGEDIRSELLKAIEESTISVIVFSKNYAASKWCLDELVKIMECRDTFQQVVLPIFYNVVPSDVGRQKGSLAETFAKHEERFKEGSNGKVEKWRAALTKAANLSGWELANGDEAKLIEEVVKEVENILAPELYVADHPVGVDDRVQELMSMLSSMESNDVCIVGVLGIGGIGKSTIARRLYNIIHQKFESRSFLANVRETSKQQNGFLILQEQLLFDIFKNETYHIKDVHHGKEVIKRRALCRKVLLVLDDVDCDEQLKELAIDRDYFGSGSRIIITTRNGFLLDSLNVDRVYTLEKLNKCDSIQLFSWHAFHKKDPPMKDYVELSDLVVDYAQGLPLVLEVLGSSLYNRSIPYWRNAIAELKKKPHDNIQRKLKISYDSLREKEKELFLDLACFFVVIDEDSIVKILKVSAENGFQGLVDRCLIKYDPYCKKFVMHDLLRDMGREIVRQESDEPGRCSRVWSHDDALEVLRNGTGTEAVEGIFLNFIGPKKFQVNAKAFEKMNRLRLLHLNNVHPSISYEHIFRRLSWLRWTSFPQKCMPSNLSMQNLIALDLCYSKLEQVWKGTKILKQLKFLYLSHCYYLTKTPDFSGLNNLEELLLNDCIRLVEVDESIGCLNKLVFLDMANCKNLRQLPLKILMLKSLEYLNLSGCSKLRELAEFKASLFRRWCTYFSSWALRTKNVDSIGFSLQGSSCLKTLNIAKCNLSHLPSEIGSLISLTDLDIGENNLCTLPDSICNLTKLQSLDMTRCNVSHLPSEIGRLISLNVLILGKSNLRTLPVSICNLTSLVALFLDDCAMLQSLPELPASLEGVCASGCASLEYIELKSLVAGTYMYFNGCHKLAENNFVDKVIEAMIQQRKISSVFFLQAQSVSTGLGLSLDNGFLASSGDSPFLGLMGDDIDRELHRHDVEIDRFLQIQDFHAPESSDYSPLDQYLHAHLDQDFHAPESSDYSPLDQYLHPSLDQDFHALNSSYYSLQLNGSEVPRLFEYQSTGSYLSFKVPPPLINQKKVQGLFVCLVFIASKEKCENHYFECTRTIHINKVKISDSYCAMGDGDLMWLKFVPTNQLKGGDEVEISLATDGSIQFIKCGIGANIVYEVDDANISTEKTNDEELTRYTPHHLTPTLILEEEEDEEGEEFFDPTN